jgi:hypothetical protein
MQSSPLGSGATQVSVAAQPGAGTTAHERPVVGESADGVPVAEQLTCCGGLSCTMPHGKAPPPLWEKVKHGPVPCRSACLPVLQAEPVPSRIGRFICCCAQGLETGAPHAHVH